MRLCRLSRTIERWPFPESTTSPSTTTSALRYSVWHSTTNWLARSRYPLAAPTSSCPQALPAAVRQLLRDLANGSPVHLVPADAELTTQQATDLLGISRTYVVRLIDQGDLPAHPSAPTADSSQPTSSPTDRNAKIGSTPSRPSLTPTSNKVSSTEHQASRGPRRLRPLPTVAP